MSAPQGYIPSFLLSLFVKLKESHRSFFLSARAPLTTDARKSPGPAQ